MRIMCDMLGMAVIAARKPVIRMLSTSVGNGYRHRTLHTTHTYIYMCTYTHITDHRLTLHILMHTHIHYTLIHTTHYRLQTNTIHTHTHYRLHSCIRCTPTAHMTHTHTHTHTHIHVCALYYWAITNFDWFTRWLFCVFAKSNTQLHLTL